jgi:hypothetical protein
MVDSRCHERLDNLLRSSNYGRIIKRPSKGDEVFEDEETGWESEGQERTERRLAIN